MDIIKLIYQLIKDIFKGVDKQKIKNKIKKFTQFSKNKFFYNEKLLQELLYERDLSILPKTRFIKYTNYSNYYLSDIKKIKIKLNGNVKQINIPYKELINYIKFPFTQIFIDKSISKYYMPQDLIKMTKLNLLEFKNNKKRTFDGEILRISNFEKLSDNNFNCKLEVATYFDQVRTNLTLDLPLEHDPKKTLRILDTNSKNLKTFKESILVNSIGVSTVVCYYSRKKDDWFYFMKIRRKEQGVYINMLSTISGVVEPPKYKINELTKYVSEEIMREFIYETGISKEEISLNKNNYKLKPLAFTRELIRGGKPQFFFLLEIKEPKKKQFKKQFKKSKEGLYEFKNGLLSDFSIYKNALSPEFATNLLYAFDYLQKERFGVKTDIIDFDLE